MTLLKLGLCQELSQRFILEYVLKYRKQDVSLVFLGNPDSFLQNEKHVLVQMGPINEVDDLKLLISMVDNINAQDGNPKVKRTALHWAAIKGHDACVQLLLKADAFADIVDASGKTAFEYSSYQHSHS